MKSIACQCGFFTTRDLFHVNGRTRERIPCVCGRMLTLDCLANRPLVGSEVKELSRSLGFQPTKQCGCEKLRRKMDRLGVAGCRQEFASLAEQLREKYDATSWSDRAKASGWAVLTGLAFALNPLDPIGSLLTEAIRRAELAESTAPLPS